MKFVLGGSMRCDLEVLLESRMLIQATSGGGKSRTLRRILEQTHGKVQQIVIDPEGELVSLREKFDYVLAAAHGGDTPADPRSAALLAERLLELEASAILDLSELKRNPQVDFVKRFCEALMEAPKRLRHPVLFPIDEIQLFAPEGIKCDSTLAVIDVATRGRKRGLCLLAATQRISLFDKNAAAPLRNKLIGMTALDTDLKRAGAELGFDKAKTLTLRELENMHYWAFGPALVRTPTLVEVGPHETSHPKAGAKLKVKAPPTPAKIKALLPKLADLPAEAEERTRTLQDLQRENADLKRRAAQLERRPAPVQTSAVPAATAAELRQAQADAGQLQDRVAQLTKAVERLMKFIVEINAQDFFKAGGETVDKQAIQKAIDSATQQAVKLIESHLTQRRTAFEKWRRQGEQILEQISRLVKQDVTIKVAVKHNEPFTIAPAPKIARPPRAEPPADGSFRPSSSQQRILNALVWLEGIGLEEGDKTQVALLADQSPSSGGYFNNLCVLRTAGLLDYPRAGALMLTAAGRARAENGNIPTSSDALHEQLFAKLSSSQSAILRALIAAYPEPITKAELAERAGAYLGKPISATSGGYFNNLGTLRSLKLIDYPSPGSVVAQPVLFLEGVR